MRTVIICAGYSMTTQEDAGTVAEIVTVVGDFTYLVSDAVRQIILQRLAHAPERIILDFSALNRLDSQAASALLTVLDAARRANKELVILRDMPPQLLASFGSRGIRICLAFLFARDVGVDTWTQRRTPHIPGQENA